MNDSFPNTVIAVGSRSMCIWDREIVSHNLDFCSSFEPKWFLDAAARHLGEASNVEEVPQAAALAIRQNYHHALETFFALLFALFQAPQCIPAWLELYEFSVLRDLIRAVNSGSPILNAWRCPQSSWPMLAQIVTQYGWPGDSDTVDRFAALWQRFGSEYLNPQRAAEHAALKHGFRARPSGGGIRIGVEPEYGVSPPPEAMEWVGGSPHGSSTFVASPIPPETGRRKAVHYKLSVQNTYWRLDTTIMKIDCLSMSMANVLGAARIQSGEPPGELLFHRPEDPEAFELPWRKSTGVTGFGVSHAGPGESVTKIGRETVENEMKMASGLLDPQDESAAT